MRNWRSWALWLAVALACVAVFTAYLSPHLALELSTRLWGCFT